jgi:hypothetical protein
VLQKNIGSEWISMTIRFMIGRYWLVPAVSVSGKKRRFANTDVLKGSEDFGQESRFAGLDESDVL